MRRGAAGLGCPLVLLTVVLTLSCAFQGVQAATPIVFDSFGSPNPRTCASSGACSSISWTHNVGSGSNGILVVGVSWEGTVVPTVAFGATMMTPLGDHINNNDKVHVGLWSLPVSSGASGTVLVTFSTPLNFIVGGSASYFNVASTGTVSSADNTPPATTTASDLVATSAGDLIVDTLGIANTRVTLTASPTGLGQTHRWNSGSLSNAGSLSFLGAGSDQPASGSSVTMSWSISPASFWSLIAVPLIPTSTPIPEYPVGLPVLAILTALAYGLIRRRTRNDRR